MATGADLWLGATARSEQLELIRGLGASFSFRSGFDGEQAVRAGQGVDLGVFLTGSLADFYVDFQAVEGVADVFQLVVEVLAVAGEVVLKAFQEVGREVGASAFGVAVGSDVGEAFLEELTVSWLAYGDAVAAHPVGRPGEGFDQGEAVFVPAFDGVVFVEVAAGEAEEVLEGVFFGCVHGWERVSAVFGFSVQRRGRLGLAMVSKTSK